MKTVEELYKEIVGSKELQAELNTLDEDAVAIAGDARFFIQNDP